MSMDRILGSSAVVEISTANGVLTLEVDSFSSSQKHELKQWHPLGQIGERAQLIYKGWDMDFKIGKTGPEVSSFFNAIDAELLAGRPAPRASVVETIKHFDGSIETWKYPDTLLYGYKHDASNAEDEIKEDFKGVSQLRIPG